MNAKKCKRPQSRNMIMPIDQRKICLDLAAAIILTSKDNKIRSISLSSPFRLYLNNVDKSRYFEDDIWCIICENQVVVKKLANEMGV